MGHFTYIIFLNKPSKSGLYFTFTTCLHLDVKISSGNTWSPFRFQKICPWKSSQNVIKNSLNAISMYFQISFEDNINIQK